MRYTIKDILHDVESEESGKTVAEAIVVESDDGLHDAVLTFAELRKRMLLRVKQQAKQAGVNGHADPRGANQNDGQNLREHAERSTP